MSINAPVVLTPLEPPPATTKLADLWTSLFPWDDMQAKGQPERYLGLGTDIVPTLSVLATGGGPNKRLLKADITGRLLASAVPYGFDTFIGFQGVTKGFPIPNDITLYAPGMSVMFVASATTAPNIETRRIINVVRNPTAPFFAVDTPLQLTYTPGDSILTLPETTIVGHLPHKRPFDWQATNSPADGTAASVTSPAAAGRVIVLGPVDAGQVAHNAGVEASAIFQILDGAGGTEIWRQYFGIKEASAPQADRWSKEDLNLRSTAGNALQLQFASNVASIGQTVSAAGWFENAGSGTIT